MTKEMEIQTADANMARTLPLWKNVLKEMWNAELIVHGGTVLWTWLEAKFKHDHESWEFRNEWFPLRNAIIKMGFMVTESGCDGHGFRILEREEMADAASNRLTKARNTILRDSVSLGSVNLNGMETKEAKRIEFMSVKCARVAFDMSETMAKRKNVEHPPMKQIE